MEARTKSLTNAQLEILKTFRHELSEDELKKLKKTLVSFFAEILMAKADKVWEEENWDENKINEMLNTKMRKRS